MKKLLRAALYVIGVLGITALGWSFGSVWGFVAFISSFLLGTTLFVTFDGPNNVANKKTTTNNKTSAFSASTKDDKTYDMEKVLGEYKGTYLSNVKKSKNIKSTEAQNNTDNELSL